MPAAQHRYDADIAIAARVTRLCVLAMRATARGRHIRATDVAATLSMASRNDSHVAVYDVALSLTLPSD